ncbi:MULTISPECIES: uracil-DNA glycosylase [unclassified Undibacterium]|uniref:uracil-DNA glycosylase n=1 Tax=unclassified Undibacterium TaxID=2630295 RepID=UPI002AC9BF8E|nr:MULTISPECIES: uracil-DNA glycosylase [unclassified Undibacterium]MEB0138349.1 uracil-DNA glycosylase [Undibacterium sp. CCC2.1]MEB0172726.1 uracil-DNA glycosylase [Undibacterium sp. CCC1.1]MEB0174724.1 uracil-DNA glycosylase [Undibacterium sp. CCC3.4]MEB0213921.1 uracil-DNA glycosylase [Undibacterium sp. 5I2]WPX42645.1 uracil-DNA glycosylase [Undibacterium sp. CCC3.4]
MSAARAFLPALVAQALAAADPSWQAALQAGLQAMHAADPDYLPALVAHDFLPSEGRLFAAFTQPLAAVRHILVGEGPYPRAASATGVCFMDGAVSHLWAADGSGLAKPVNRATSLRNFMKMLLVADGLLAPDCTTASAMAALGDEIGGLIQTLPQLQQNLHAQGFLLLNASLVFRDHVAPAKDGKAWQPLLRCVFDALIAHHAHAGLALPVLVLWGKIAEQLTLIKEVAAFPQVRSEHPYNLSFIKNQEMQNFFRPMQLLKIAAKKNYVTNNQLLMA